MWQAQRKESKREARRKGIVPVAILLGHKVKSFMTVIFLGWGAIGFYIVFYAELSAF